MSTDEFKIPDNPLDRFCAIYTALMEQKRWFQDPTPLRFAAVTLSLIPGTPRSVALSLENMANELKNLAGWTSPLQSSIRFAVAAILLRSGDTARDFTDEVERVKDLFKQHGLRRGSVYFLIAVLILRDHLHGRKIGERDVERMRAIYDMMKSHHFWLTGVDDYPACAFLSIAQTRTGGAFSPEEIGVRVEEFYNGLNDQGFSRGNQLQTASHVLFFNPDNTSSVVEKFNDIYKLFADRGLYMHGGDYDEVAILTYLHHTPSVIVDRALSDREAIATLKPTPPREISFSLCAGTAFLSLARLSEKLQKINDIQALMQVQSILQAQQAAAMASVAAASAAASN